MRGVGVQDIKFSLFFSLWLVVGFEPRMAFSSISEMENRRSARDITLVAFACGNCSRPRSDDSYGISLGWCGSFLRRTNER